MSDVGEVWRRLHNFLAAGPDVLELYEIYGVAKDTEAQIVQIREAHAALTEAHQRLQGEFADLQTAYANLDALYKGKLAEAESAHGQAINALTAEREARHLDTDKVIANLAERLTKAQADHQGALDRLGREEAGRQAMIDALDVEVASRQARLDGIKREAERLLKGGE